MRASTTVTYGIAICFALWIAAHVSNACAQQGTEELEELWPELEKSPAEASRAMMKISALPADTVVEFMRDNLKPLKLSQDRAAELLEQLGNEDEETWMAAYEELSYFDPRLAVELPDLMRQVTESPARQRLVEILCGRKLGSLAEKTIQLRTLASGGHNFFGDGSSWWAEADVAKINAYGWGNVKNKWTRAVRAIAILEHIDTMESQELLQEMAKGHEQAAPTRAAKVVLEGKTP